MLRTIFKRRNNIPISATADTFEIEYEPEIVLPPSSGQPKPPGALQNTYELWYLGTKQVAEAKTISTLIYTIKQMRKKSRGKTRVTFSFAQGTLNIQTIGGNKETILSLPFYSVALCVLDPVRESGCIAISSTVKMVHEVHVFQGITHEQAQEVVLGLGLAFSEAGKVQNQVFADNPSLFQWENYQMSRSRVDHNYNPSVVHNTPTRHSPHLTPTLNWNPQKIPAYNSGKGMRPKLKHERELSSEQSQLFASPSPTSHIRVPADISYDATPKDKYDSLEDMISVIKENNKQIMASYKRDNAFVGGFFFQAVRAIFSSNTLRLNDLLTRKNININSKDSSGNSLLHYATLQCNPKMVLFLIKQNADINQGDKHGITPLHCAAANHSTQMVKCLLRHNADVNVVDENRRSPIFMLYIKNTQKGELVTHLVENGAFITREDINGLKPADIWMDLQSFQQSLITSLCNCFMQSVPIAYQPGDILESFSTSISGSLHTTTIPTRHASVLSLPPSDVDTILMFHNEPLTEEERIAKLEKLRLSSSQFSLVSEDPLAEEARKLCENTAAMVKVADKIVQHLDREQPMMPLDLSNINEVLKQLGVSEELTMSSTFYQQLKNLQEEVKRKDWERRKYGHSLKRSQTRAEGEFGMRGLEGTGPRELYLPDGAKLGQLKKSASETMLHLINVSKEVTQREGPTMDDGILSTQKQIEIRPGFMRAMRQLKKPIFSFFASEAVTIPKPDSKNRRVQPRNDPPPELKSPKLRRKPSYTPKPLNIENDLDSMQGDSLSSVPETGSENSEIFNKLVSKLDPEGDRMGKITQLPLIEHPSVSDMFKMESFSRAKSIYNKRQDIPGGWMTSQEQEPAKSHFHIDPDSGKTRFVFSDEARQRADSEPTKKQQFGPSVQANDRVVKREDALKRRTGNYSDSTIGNKLSTRPVHLQLGTRHESHSKSNISGGGVSNIIAHPLGIEDSNSEPGAIFIFKLLKLSANYECLGYLLAHMGLSKFFKRFLLYARASGVSEEMRINMAILINNLFEVMKSESQRKSIEAGMLELVVQLVDSYWPLPGVALSVLTNVIDSEYHHNYITTVAKSPIGPLLRCLNFEILDIDSGIESGRKRTSKTREQRESIDTSSGIWTESTPLQRLQQPEHLPASRSSRDSMYDSGKHSFDFRKKLEQTSEPLRSVLLPISDPKTVILHILAYASHNDTMKSQLMNGHSLRIINECLYDSKEEHVLLALNTIANVALKPSSHRVLAEATLLRKLRSFLKQESMVAHQAARALIYMGEFDVEDVYLFDKSDVEVSIKYASMEDGTPFVKGGTLEALVEVLTNLPRSLWGGIQLMSPGPKGNCNASLNRSRSRAVRVEPTEEKIFEFFLTTCRSFCEPIILFRLLIHRFRDRFSYSLFDWNLVDLPASRLVYHALPPTASIPKTQRLVLRVVQSWLRNFPEDFKKFDYMTDEVKHLLLYPLKKVKGPYYDYGQTIKNLLSQIHIKQRFKEPDPIVFRNPHHQHVYHICNKYIVEGMLPVKLEDAILLSALQIYIETVTEKKQKKVFSQESTKLKNIVPAEFMKVKNIGRRIKDKHLEYTRQQLNERDSKHLYIQYCHELPGFGCQFFAIKEIILKRKYSPVQSRLLGISFNKIVVLDIHTKDSLIEFPFSTLKSWFPNTNDKTIVLTFKKRRYLFLVQNTR
ncbi:hypothetical protein LOD99_13584 [Oopsacas minuta]|uniref:Uncharacterized protein n=1 Tax=Oopsacas minuta TaxID=111878 RepID=A0AAV7KIW1_9METZ|nr:hypothetical protein LOD99_13584 [Oopsacas minuta]